MFAMNQPFAFACGPVEDVEPRRRRGPGHHDEMRHEFLFSAIAAERGERGARGDGGGRGRDRDRGRGRGRGPRGGWGARGGRVRRGDVRAAILALLAEQPRHGYDVIQELSARTGGMWNPSPGSVYPTLAQLEDEGLVEADEVDAKRVFSLTDAGREEADRREGPAPWDEVNDDVTAPDGELDETSIPVQVTKLMAAVKQFRFGSTPEQRQAATKVLADARRRLYLILADEPTDENE